MTGFPVRALFVLAPAVLLLAAACGGGGDSMTLEEYLLEVERLDGEFEAASDTLDAEFDELFATAGDEAALLDGYRGLFDDLSVAVREFIVGLEALDPPGDAEAAHDATVDAGNDVLDVFDEWVERVRGVESFAEVEEIAQELGEDESFGRLDDACQDTQALADENEIEIDLNCEE